MSISIPIFLRRKLVIVLFNLIVGLLLLSINVPKLAASGDENWDDRFFLSGLSGYGAIVYAVVTDSQGNLYIGGSFDSAGPRMVNDIVKWDGYSWATLGNPQQTYLNYVLAMVIDSEDNLYASDGSTIIKWDGYNWTIVAQNLGSPDQFAMAVDSQDNLYIAGYSITVDGIDAHHIAKWNGSSWSTLGSGTNYAIRTLFVDDHDNLYTGGEFTTAGGVNANRIAKWDGHQWSALGTGLTGQTSLYTWVDDIVMDSKHNLYVSGSFTQAGGKQARSIARWNGSSWSALKSGLQNNRWWEWEETSGGAMVIDRHDNLYTSGIFVNNGEFANYAVKWDGSNWHLLGNLDFEFGYNNAMVIDNSGNLIMGGSFHVINQTEANNIAKWDGYRWSALGKSNGINNVLDTAGKVEALAIDNKNNLYAGGTFDFAGGVKVNNIARWNGYRWCTVGSGVDKGGIAALAADSRGNIYAGGYFELAGNQKVNNIARWNGQNWYPLGAGLNNFVSALIVDKQNNLYAGGYFTMAGNVTTQRVAKWDGNKWSSVGNGIPGDNVRALVFDSQGNLYAGGAFGTIGGVPFNSVAKWNGNKWLPLGNGLGWGVTALAVDGKDNLYATGDLNGVYQWDGHMWNNIGTFTNSNLGTALVVDSHDNLYIGYTAQGIDDIEANYIAKWDGSNWSNLGSGLSGTDWGPNSLVVDNYDNLYAGGDFLFAGNKPSSNIAMWHSTIPTTASPSIDITSGIPPIYLPLVYKSPPGCQNF